MSTWSIRTTVGALAVAAGIAGVGGAAITAATDSGFHGMGGGPPGGMGGGRHGGGGPPAAPAPQSDAAAADTVHGERVVADGRGGFDTLLSQTGRVTAISPTSITARSDDGFVQTYVIRETGTEQQPPFAVDQRVAIAARREGEAAVVTTMRPPL